MASNSISTATHVLVIPYPAQGHMIPLLDLTRQLTLGGLDITVLVTPKNLPILNPVLTAHPSIQTLVLPFPHHPQLPPGVENIKDLGNSANPMMISALSRLQKPITDWFTAHPCPPRAIFSDFFLGWTHNLALQLGVPRVVFIGVGAFTGCVLSHLFTDMDRYKGLDVVEFADLPHSPSFKKGHLPSIYRLYKESDPNTVTIKDGMRMNLSSWGCVFNSFRSLEGEYLEHMAKITEHGRVYGVGPVNLLGASGSFKRVNPDQEAANEVLDWLERCPDGSVLYVSFGSQKWLTEPQSEALAMALEQSGTRFIWVARTRPGSKVVPDGFEDRVVGRGFVARGWVQQLEVLNHRALGGFLSHCGWNSVFESVAAGVMILAWPMEADQFVNAKLLVDDMGVAVLACEGPDTVPDSDKLARIVRESMGGDVSQRQRARELKVKAVEAVGEGGSSLKDLDELVKELTIIGMEKH